MLALGTRWPCTAARCVPNF